jgi:hypothetical protein
MNQESVDVITRDGFTKLLQGSGCSRMGRDIAVQNAATSDFHQHDHVQHTEASRDGYQEVSGHDGLGVIANKRPPVLRKLFSYRLRCGPTGRKIELHRKFGCDALLPQVGSSFTMRRISPSGASSSLARTCSGDM